MKRLYRVILLCTLTAWPLASAHAAPGEHFPQTRARVLSTREIANMNYAQRRYAINEMYARHGYEFPRTQAIREQFFNFGWYWPVRGRTQEQCQARFNANEKRNLARLAAVRAADASDDDGVFGRQEEDYDRSFGHDAALSFDPDDEFYPQTRKRYMSNAEVFNLSAEQRRYATNEMYARRGFVFKNAVLNRKFSGFGWYIPVPGRTQAQCKARFNKFERANLQKLIGVRDMAR